MFRPDLTPNYRSSKTPSQYPSCTKFKNSQPQTPFHTPNLPTAIFSHHCSSHSPHPYSISYLGYTSPPWRPHMSHCNRIQCWIPLMGPFLDSVMYPVMCSGLEDVITLQTHIAFITCSLHPAPSIG